jgi:hypothetical protein
VFKRIVAEFEPPPMDAAIREELADFVERRKAEGGAPTDFSTATGWRNGGRSRRMPGSATRISRRC